EPPWLAGIRRAGLERFLSAGLPTTKDEAWRYTNAAPIAKTPFRIAGDEEVRLPDRPHPGPLPGGEGARIVFVNGRHSLELSRGSFGLAAAASLKTALREGAGEVEHRLGKVATLGKGAVPALNGAFLQGGAVVQCPRGAGLE